MTVSAISLPASIGFISAILLTLLGLAYLITLLASFAQAGMAFPPPAPVQLAGAIVSIFSSIALVVTMVALRRVVPAEREIFAELAAVFMALMSVSTCANRFVQLSVVPKYSGPADAKLLELIHPYGDKSVMFGFESLGWGLFYGLGALFAAFAFGDQGLELWICWLFLIGGVLSLLFALGVILRQKVLSLLGFPAWSVLLTASAVLMAIWFRLLL